MTCKAEGCTRKPAGLGFCHKHLWRYHKHGDPEKLVQPKLGNKRHTNYGVWRGMIQRCYYPNGSMNYKDYGGRGIRVCDRWRNDFWAFVEDMGPRPPKSFIDRIDNDGNYEPGNCRWVTRATNARNRRNCQLTVRAVLDARRRHSDGESIMSLSRGLKVPYETLRLAIIGKTWKDI